MVLALDPTAIPDLTKELLVPGIHHAHPTDGRTVNELVKELGLCLKDAAPDCSYVALESATNPLAQLSAPNWTYDLSAARVSDRFKFDMLTLNVWGLPELMGFGSPAPERFLAIADSLSKSSVDFAVLQEMWIQETRVIIENSGFSFWAQGADDFGLSGNTGLVTLSRYPILETDVVHFRHKGGLEKVVDKGFLYTLIQLPTGDHLALINLHLASDGSGTNFGGCAAEERSRQLDELEGWLKVNTDPNVPRLIAGDFNIVAQSREYFRLQGLGADLWEYDQSTDNCAGNTIVPEKNHWIRDQEQAPRRIDYTFLAGLPASNLCVSSTVVYTQNPFSDHFGVRSTVTLNHEPVELALAR